MTVSVLIPYAGEPLGRLDRTVKSALNCLPDEVIVYGDGVHPVLFPELDREVRVGSCDTNQGLPHALNSARGMAKSTHVMWVSTGDSVDSGRLMHLPPDEKGQFCGCYIESRRLTLPMFEDWHVKLWEDNQFCGSGMIVPVTVWDAVGGFDERLRYCSDWHFAVKVHAYCGWEYVDQVLATANEYEGGLTDLGMGVDKERREADRRWVNTEARAMKKGGLRV